MRVGFVCVFVARPRPTAGIVALKSRAYFVCMFGMTVTRTTRRNTPSATTAAPYTNYLLPPPPSHSPRLTGWSRPLAPVRSVGTDTSSGLRDDDVGHCIPRC